MTGNAQRPECCGGCVFARSADNAVWHITNSLGTLGSWATLGGIINNGPIAQINYDGRVAVFAEGPDSTVWTIEQSSPGSWQ